MMNLIMVKPALSSAFLHLLVIGMLMFSFDLTPTPRQPNANNVDIIDAVTVDSVQVEQELNDIKALEQQKQLEREKQLADIQKQSQEAEHNRQQEERRLADIKKQQQVEETRRKEEERKLVDIKKQQLQEQQLLKEEEIKLAQAKKQQDELKKRQEEEEQLRKEVAEKKRQEELRLAEQARKKQEAERLAAEQKQRQVAQDKQDMTVINSYVARIANAIEREFNTAGLTEGLSCIFEIRMIPGGEVAEVKIVKTSGNSVFDSRAEIAVKRASPLPVPDNPRIFGKMREIRLTFAPN
jgi:colicin import membrane protein